MMQAMSRRYQAEKRLDLDPDSLSERDRLAGPQCMFMLPSITVHGDFNFDKASYRLPVERDKQNREARVALIRFLDGTQTGRISTEDLKFGFARIIHIPDHDVADAEHMIDEVVRHAQRAVQDLMLDGAPRKDDDVLTKEFRVFLTYLQGYVDMWEIFSEADSKGNETVDLDEFISAAPKLKEWGLKDPALMKNPASVFAQIDVDESGYVTFGEFADFCVQQGLVEEVTKDLRMT